MIKAPDALKEAILSDTPCSTMFSNGFAMIRTHHPRTSDKKNSVTRLRYNETSQQFEPFNPDAFSPAERRRYVRLMLSEGVRSNDLASLFKVAIQQITNDSGAGMR